MLPRVHSVKNLSEAVFFLGDHEGTIQVEKDEFRLKTKLIPT